MPPLHKPVSIWLVVLNNAISWHSSGTGDTFILVVGTPAMLDALQLVWTKVVFEAVSEDKPEWGFLEHVKTLLIRDNTTIPVAVINGQPDLRPAAQWAEALGAATAHHVMSGGKKTYDLVLSPEIAESLDRDPDLAGAFFDGFFLGRYLDPKPLPQSAETLGTLNLDPHQWPETIKRADWVRAGHIARCTHIARDLIAQPPNFMSPSGLSKAITEQARSSGISVKVHDVENLRRSGLNGFVAVGSGSTDPPRMIELAWFNDGDSPVWGLFGKAVTYDAGGLCLQPGRGMDEMKGDMAGGAIVAGVIMAAATLGLKRNIRGYIGIAENMPDGRAFRSGDVITMANGMTVEVINTDAEGRIVLADMMASALKVRTVDAAIDLGTLTGTILSALGNRITGYFSNNDSFSAELEAAARRTRERFWRMPLEKDYLSYLNSDFADTRTFSYQGPGAITAALFLSKFVDETPWLHLDIGSTGMNTPRTNLSPGWASSEGLRTLLDLIEKVDLAEVLS